MTTTLARRTPGQTARGEARPALIALLCAEPTLSMPECAARLGISRQRVHQILIYEIGARYVGRWELPLGCDLLILRHHRTPFG